MEYLVTWEIEVDAETPLAAAMRAREIQLDPQSHADHFRVETDEACWTVNTNTDEEAEMA